MFTGSCLFQIEHPGIAHLFYNMNTPYAKFFPKTDKIIGISESENENDLLIAYYLKDHKREKIFAIKNVKNLSADQSYFLNKFCFIGNKAIILGWVSEESVKSIHYNYEMNLEDNYTVQRTDLPALLAWAVQSQKDRSLFVSDDGNSKTFTVYNYKTGSKNSYNYPVLFDNYDKPPYIFCYGRNSDEIVFTISDYKEQIYIFFYNIKSNKINTKIVVPPEFSEYYNTWFFSDILLSPDARYIACVDYAQGIWLMDLEKKELVEIRSRPGKNGRPEWPFHVWDWSWNSDKFIFSDLFDYYLFDKEIYFENIGKIKPKIFKINIIEY